MTQCLDVSIRILDRGGQSLQKATFGLIVCVFLFFLILLLYAVLYCYREFELNGIGE